MGDYRTVAAITVVLQNLLQQAVSVLPGAHVRTGRPERVGVEHPAGVVNVFLYQVAPNATFRNTDLPTRRADGTFVQRPRVALDLYYLLSFYGEDREQIPQKLLGLAVSALNAWPYPILGPTPPPEAAAEFPDPALLTFSPVTLTLEELSKFWLMFQLPYALSIAYRGSVALVDSNVAPPPPALPVRRAPVVAVTTAGAPRIDSVAPQQVSPGGQLTVTGSHLGGTGIEVHIGSATAAPVSSASGSLAVALPGGLPAGPLPLQVVRQVSAGDPPAPRTVAESNVASFVLLPEILQATYSPADPAAPDGTGAGPAITVTLSPAVVRGQVAALFLDELDPPPDRAPHAYAIPAGSGTAGESLTFAAAGVAAATYLVRVQVDGAASPLTVQDGRYAGPTVTVP